MPGDAEKASEQRAKDLREEIEQLAQGGSAGRHPRTPRDFIEEELRERAAREKAPADTEEPASESHSEENRPLQAARHKAIERTRKWGR